MRLCGPVMQSRSLRRSGAAVRLCASISGEHIMRRTSWLCSTIAAAMLGLATAAHADGLAKPQLALRQTVEAMPTGQKQEVRVLTATFEPGDRTVTHTHRFPVTVYVLEGAFTLELDGREPIVVKAGNALLEPPLLQMIG